jgi:hypothetical protein
MTTATLTAELTQKFSDVPPSLIASTVRAAAAAPAAGTPERAVESIARTDVAALAEAVRRSAATRT